MNKMWPLNLFSHEDEEDGEDESEPTVDVTVHLTATESKELVKHTFLLTNGDEITELCHNFHVRSDEYRLRQYTDMDFSVSSSSPDSFYSRADWNEVQIQRENVIRHESEVLDTDTWEEDFTHEVTVPVSQLAEMDGDITVEVE